MCWEGEIGTIIESLATAEKVVKEMTAAKDAVAAKFSASEKRMERRMDALKDV